MNRENSIIYIVSSPDIENTFEELKIGLGVERAININMDLFIKTHIKISDYKNGIILMAYSKTRKYYDLRWLSYDEPGFLDVSGKSYSDAFISTAELAFKTGARKVLWINHLCPFISTDDIEIAFSNINDKNIVVGHAKNGGVYLLGFPKDALKFFDNFYPLKENIVDEITEKIKKNRFSSIAMEEKILIKDDESLRVWVDSGEYDMQSKKKDINPVALNDEMKHRKRHEKKENSSSPVVEPPHQENSKSSDQVS